MIARSWIWYCLSIGCNRTYQTRACMFWIMNKQNLIALAEQRLRIWDPRFLLGYAVDAATQKIDLQSLDGNDFTVGKSLP